LQGLALSTRKEEARDWTNSFKVIEIEGHKITHILKGGPCVLSVWGIAGVGKSDLVKTVYYRVMLGLYPFYWTPKEFPERNRPLRRKFTAYSWVVMPHPFSFMEFSRRLLLDFLSDELQAKETAIVGLMEGQDPIQGCLRFLREHICFVVIDGLRSTDDWDLIKASFLSSPITGNIIVITNEESVGWHCVDNKGDPYVVNVKGLDTKRAFELFTGMVGLISVKKYSYLTSDQPL
jgi:hypothetical protein